MEVVMKTMQQARGTDPQVQAMMDEMISHPAWLGDMTGVEAETLLRQKPSFTYLLRQGEKGDHFYLSYVNGTNFIHLPITILYSTHQWFYQNSYPHFAKDLVTFIPDIMHQEAAECHPLEQFVIMNS